MAGYFLIILATCFGFYILIRLPKSFRSGKITCKFVTYTKEDITGFSYCAAFWVLSAFLIPVMTALFVLGPSSSLHDMLYSPFSIGSVHVLDGAAFMVRAAIVFLGAYVVCLFAIVCT